MTSCELSSQASERAGPECLRTVKPLTLEKELTGQLHKPIAAGVYKLDLTWVETLPTAVAGG